MLTYEVNIFCSPIPLKCESILHYISLRMSDFKCMLFQVLCFVNRGFHLSEKCNLGISTNASIRQLDLRYIQCHKALVLYYFATFQGKQCNFILYDFCLIFELLLAFPKNENHKIKLNLSGRRFLLWIECFTFFQIHVLKP